MFYENLPKDKVEKIVDVGEDAIDLMFDKAHNNSGFDEDFLEFSERDWEKVALWETHLRRVFLGVINDIKFDLKKGRFVGNRKEG